MSISDGLLMAIYSSVELILKNIDKPRLPGKLIDEEEISPPPKFVPALFLL